ncbi:MAG: sulfite exporter TauE/SafE family protein [Thermodesulfobacteriota bacterium]
MPEYFLTTALILFSGAVIQGLSGFGGALFSMPLLLLYADKTWAAPVMVLCYAMNRIPALFLLRKTLMWNHSFLLIAAFIPGAFFGVWLLKESGTEFIMRLLGSVLVLFALYKAAAPRFNIIFSRLWALPAGFLSGVLGGAFGTDGPPVVVYAAIRPWTKEQVVGMLQSFFLLSNLIIILTYGYHGLLNISVIRSALFSSPFAVGGILLGLKMNRRIQPRHFEIIFAVLLGAMGCFLWV